MPNDDNIDIAFNNAAIVAMRGIGDDRDIGLTMVNGAFADLRDRLRRAEADCAALLAAAKQANDALEGIPYTHPASGILEIAIARVEAAGKTR